MVRAFRARATFLPQSDFVSGGLQRLFAPCDRNCWETREPFAEAANGLTERRRSRTDRAWGCHTAQVLKPWRGWRESGFPKPFEVKGISSRRNARHGGVLARDHRDRSE